MEGLEGRGGGGDRAHEHGDVLVVCDNTWASGYCYRPLEHGADLSIVAGTKYLGGHS
ncbi:PLP-dependent transferase, partial [Spiribacter roseus]|uniref:PLP-dependent transferase n=1 Tax=Spiribacter roseus TaxID=1855875 RepID=UPI001F439D04